MKRSFLCMLTLLAACAGTQEAVKKAPKAALEKPLAPLQLFELPAQVTYKEAQEKRAQGDLAGAKVRLETYLRKEPKDANALADAGGLAEELGDVKGAEGFYLRALEVDLGQGVAALGLARLDRLGGKVREAEAICRAALGKHEGDPRLLNSLAATLRLEKKFDEAEAAVRKILLRHPKDADAYKNLALVEADRGRVRLAEVALASARRFDGNDAGIPNTLGLLAMRQGQVILARDHFQEAVALDPNFAVAWANLGAVALSYRDYPAALAAYAKAVSLDGSRWDVHLAYGWALEGAKKPKEARAEYQRVLALQDNQEDALYGRAVALKAEGDLAGAMEAFKVYLAQPGAVKAKQAQSQIATLDLRLKNPPQAARPPAASAGKPHQAGQGEVDLSALPQNAAGAQAPEAPASALPAEAPAQAPGPVPSPQDKDAAPKPASGEKAPALPAAESPLGGKDGGLQRGGASGS